MERIEQQVNDLTKDVQTLSVGIAVQGQQIKSLDAKVDGISASVNTIQEDISGIEKHIIKSTNDNNKRLWAWLKILLVFIVGGGMAGGGAQVVKAISDVDQSKPAITQLK